MNTIVALQDREHPYLKKNTQLVRISNTISLLQRKLWNILLFNAYDKLGKENIFSISLIDLKKEMNWQTGNYQVLPDALEGLCQTSVRWGILDGESNFGITSLLSGAYYEDGIINYSFAPHLIPFLADPNLFGLINIRLSCRLKSKYSLSLYENSVVFIDPDKKTGISNLIGISDLYELLGAQPHTQVRDFKRDCLEPAIAEVNAKTNIKLDVRYDRSGKGRSGKINGVHIVVSLKPQQDLDFDNVVEIQLDQKIVEKMVSIGVTPTVAMRLATQFDVDYLEDKLKYLQETTTTILSKPKFFVKSVKENWSTEEKIKNENVIKTPSVTKKLTNKITDDDAPEITWYKSLDNPSQEIVKNIYRTHLLESTKNKNRVEVFDKKGPLDPHCIVFFGVFLRMKKNEINKAFKENPSLPSAE